MAERARACLSPSTVDDWSVTPPAECDPAMRRDGIEPKPPAGTGERAWWLGSCSARTPAAGRWPTGRRSSSWLSPSRTIGPPGPPGPGPRPPPQRRPGWAAALLDLLEPRLQARDSQNQALVAGRSIRRWPRTTCSGGPRPPWPTRASGPASWWPGCWRSARPRGPTSSPPAALAGFGAHARRGQHARTTCTPLCRLAARAACRPTSPRRRPPRPRPGPMPPARRTPARPPGRRVRTARHDPAPSPRDDPGDRVTSTATTRGRPAPARREQYAAELAALAAADDRPRPPGWRLSPQAVVTYLLGDGDGDHAEVRRAAPADGGRRRHPGHRPGAAAARRAGHGQDLGLRAPGRGDQRRLDAARPGHRGHAGGGDPLRLELRPAARRGPVARRAGAEPDVPGHGRGPHRPGRGADPDAVRRAGRAHHDPVREDAADPRARRRRCRRARASTSSPPPTTATAGVNELSSALRRRFNTVVLPVPGHGRGGGRHRHPPGRPSSAGRWSCPRCRRRPRRSAGWSPSSASCGPGSPSDGRTKLKSPSGTLSTAEAISVVTNGAGAGRPLRRRRAAARPTWPPASSAPSSRTRPPTAWSGGVPGDGGPRARRLARLLPGRRDAAASRDRATGPAPACSASATTGPARPGRCGRRWPRTGPTSC